MDNTRYSSHHPQKLFIKYIEQVDYSDLPHAEIFFSEAFNLSTQCPFSKIAVHHIPARSSIYPAITDPEKKRFGKHPYNIFSSGYVPESRHIEN